MPRRSVDRLGKHGYEVHKRAVRMVLDHEHEYPSQWKAIESISKKLINHGTLRIWSAAGEGETISALSDARISGLAEG